MMSLLIGGVFLFGVVPAAIILILCTHRAVVFSIRTWRLLHHAHMLIDLSRKCHIALRNRQWDAYNLIDEQWTVEWRSVEALIAREKIDLKIDKRIKQAS